MPIVPAAVVFDLLSGDPTARPGPDQGAAAFDAATGERATQGGWGPAPAPPWPTGGSSRSTAGWGGVVLGGLAGGCGRRALAVVNAVGDGFSQKGRPITGGHLPWPAGPFPESPHTNTTLVVVATNARMTRTELAGLTVRLTMPSPCVSTCSYPLRRRRVFAVSCGEVDADPDALGEAAFEATGRAIEAALRISPAC